MTVRPILFSGPMVRALLDGRKTQTRRVMKPQPKNPTWDAECRPDGDWRLRSRTFNVTEPLNVPYVPGDLLYAREEHRAENVQEGRRVDLSFDADGALHHCAWPIRCELPTLEARRPGMHLPRECSRLTLRVTEVRVQRLQEISEEDAKAEGMFPVSVAERPYVEGFGQVWDHLNAKRGFGWDVNPWVVAISFDVIRENVDAVLAREASHA